MCVLTILRFRVTVTMNQLYRFEIELKKLKRSVLILKTWNTFWRLDAQDKNIVHKTIFNILKN